MNNLSGNNKLSKMNNLNNKQCLAFIKDYGNFMKGNISQIKHPKTREVIKNKAKLQYIYEKCLEKYDIKSSIPSIRSSKLSKSMSTDSQKIDYEKDIIIENNKDIDDVIIMPVETCKFNRLLIKKLFKVPINEKKGKEILKRHLENPNNKKEYAVYYRNCLRNIIMFMPEFNPFMNRGKFKTYSDKLFGINRKENVIDFTYLCEKEFISAIMQDARNLNMGNFTNHENYTVANNESGFMRRLIRNKYYYYALYFILKLIKETTMYDHDTEVKHNIFGSIIFMKKLVNMDFTIKDPNVSLSFSTSSSYSSSSSGGPSGPKNSKKTGKDSTMNTVYSQLGKREYVNYIMNNGNNPRTVNDIDPYLGVKWNKLSINKLKMVVKISNVLGGKMHTYAFYAKGLYKDWKNSIKSMKPFINPITRVPFTQEDEINILNVLDKKYPNIGIPSNSALRSDVYYPEIETVRINDIYFWRFSVWYNTGNKIKANYIRLFTIHIISDLDLYHDESNAEFSPAMLFYNMDKIKKNNANSILGKTLPFKLHPAFAKYFNSFITTEEQYRDFFNMINRSV